MKPPGLTPIAIDSQVTLHFSLLLEDGAIIDSTRQGQPGTFVMGDGTLPTGFERLLLGLKVGDQRSFCVPPEQGFGRHNEKNLQQVPKKQFAKELVLEEGLMLHFEGPEGFGSPGVVQRILAGGVVIDFNHPLAGRTVLFEVDILAVCVPEQTVDLQ